MEFEFNSSGGTLAVTDNDKDDSQSPPVEGNLSLGPGDGDYHTVSTSVTADNDSLILEDDFEYPEELTRRIESVNEELRRLRNALAMERECVRKECEEAARASQDNLAIQQSQPELEKALTWCDTDAVVVRQAEIMKQQQKQIQQERYIRQMMEVEKMCSEEFFHLDKTRKQVNRLNQEVSDWRLNHGQVTGFNPYPMEVMRQVDMQARPGSSIPGRFTLNCAVAGAGIKSEPNVTLPLTNAPSLACPFSDGPWVQTFSRAPHDYCTPDPDPTWCMEAELQAASRRTGDAGEHMQPLIQL